jgi:adenylate cyclase, class 2
MAREETMRYEVEMKFPVADVSALESRLVAQGATISAAQTEVDVYFAHPARDFARTDEALRIRRKGKANFITYKGPKIDATTKTRREIDLPLPPGEETAQAWTGLLEALRFAVVGKVRKSRRKTHVVWQGRRVEASLDEVEQLGAFAELELVVEPEGVETAKACIASLAEVLGLAGSERRSYLELLMEHNSGHSGQ